MAHDLFVSYAEADRAWVEGYLLDALERAGVRYHSEDAFALGVPRLLEFERAVQESQRTLLIVSPAYLTSSFSQFVDLLGQTYGMETATWPVIPLILHSIKLPPRLAMLQSLDGTDPATWPEVLDRLCVALQRPVPAPPPPPACPYPGMAPFREADSDRFFGRDQEIEDMVGRLHAHPVMAVIGPSGSGKSSLVLAGLLPALRKSRLFGPGEWNIRVMRPSEAPLEMLAHTLEDVPRSRQLGASSGAAPAPDLELADGARLLLVVDQFEETFTLAGANSLPFQRELLRLAQARGCYVVLTVRADFYPDLMAAPLWRSIQAHRLEVAPLDEEGLKAAIVRPAEDAGVFVESALVERLLADGAGEPGILPLIQETLVLLWERLERRFLPLRAYDALVLTRGAYGSTAGAGRTGLQVAMARRADAALADLTPEQQAIARRIFLRLIAFGEGRADTRRQQPVAALRSSAGADPALFEATLRHLNDSRLLTLSGEESDAERKVDIAHEALIAGWPTLYGWLNERRESEQVRRRLDDKAAEWVRLGRGDGGLLDEIELAEAQRWLDSPAAEDMGFDPALPELVVFSRAAIEQVEYAQELARQRELAQAQALAEEQQRRAEEQARSASRLRRLVAVLAVVLLLAVGSAVFAYTQKLLAAENETTAKSNANSAATNAADAFRNASTAVSEKGRADKNLQLANLNAAAQATANAQALANADRADGNAATAQANAATAVAANALAQTNYQLASSRLAQAQTARAEADQNASEAQLRAAAEATAKANALMSFQEAQTAAAAEAIAKGNAQTAAAAEAIAKGNAQTNANMAQTSAAIAKANEQTAIAAKGQAQTNFELAASRLSQAQAAEARANANAAAAQQAQAQAQLSAQQARDSAAAEKDAKNEALSQAAIAQTAEANAQRQAAIAQTAAAGEIAAKVDAQNQAATAVAAQATAVAERNLAEQQAHIALSGQLAGQSLYYQDKQLDLSLLLSVEAQNVADTVESRNSLLNGLEYSPRLVKYLMRGSDYGSVGALSPDGRTLAMSQCAGAAAVSQLSSFCVHWGLEFLDTTSISATQQPLIDVGDRPITSMLFSPDGSILVTANANGTIMRWDMTTKSPIDSAQLPPEFGDVASVAIKPSGAKDLLAATVTSNTVTLFDMTSNPPLPTQPQLQPGDPPGTVLGNTFTSVALSPDGRALAVGMTENERSGGMILVWDVVNKRLKFKKPLQGHTGDIMSLAFSPDGTKLVSGSTDRLIQLWDLNKNPPGGQPLRGHSSTVRSLAFNGRTLVSWSSCTNGYAACNGEIGLWEVGRSQPLGIRLPGHIGAVTSVAFSPDGNLLASGGDDQTIQLWNLAASTPISSVLTGPNSAITTVAFSPDSATLVSGSADGTIWLWDVKANRPLGPPLQDHTQAVMGLAFSSDGLTIATSSCSDRSLYYPNNCAAPEIHLWKVAGPQLDPLGVLHPSTEGDVTSLAFSPDGKTLASGFGILGWDAPDTGALTLWDIASQQPFSPTLSIGQYVWSVAYSPNGKTVATGGNQDSTLRLWDVAASQQVGGPLTGHSDTVKSVAFSPDGKMLASASDDATIRLWDVALRRQIGTALIGHTGTVDSVAFSPAGKTVASGGSDTTWIWDVDVASWQARACTIANRNLTKEESQRFFGDDKHITTCQNLPPGT